MALSPQVQPTSYPAAEIIDSDAEVSIVRAFFCRFASFLIADDKIRETVSGFIDKPTAVSTIWRNGKTST